PNTMGLIPLKIQLTYLDSLNLFIKINIANMIIKEGKTTPAVATMDPNVPLTRYPKNVAEFIAIGPGVISEIAIMSTNSVFVSHSLVPITSFSNMGSIAYPPPKENNPILKKVLNKSHKITKLY